MTIQNFPSVAVWQPFFLGGGAEAVALWILEALQEDFAVTLYTIAPVDLNQLNSMYGTHLSGEKIQVRPSFSPSLSQIANLGMSVNEIVKMAMVYLSIRDFKKESARYDAVFSAFNAIDMGRPGLQYLHWINVVEKTIEKAPFWQQQLMRWTNFSHDRLKSNLSISNSQYTADQVKKTYGIDSKVVFPPVATEIDALAWQDKDNAFVCSGRLVQAKSPHRVISILKAVRDKGFDIKLYITGGGGNTHEYRYQRTLRKIIQANSDWVYLYEDLPYKEYLAILARCRYGLHWKSEPFGISVAEMLKAGTIPFIKSHGGQVEIIGEENVDLLFSTDQEAAQKIVQVLSNENLQSKLRNTLSERQLLFTTQQFTKQIKEISIEFIKKSAKAAR